MKKLIYLFAAFAGVSSLHAQQFDKTFNNTGWVTESITNDYQLFGDVKVQSDGRIVVAGSYLDSKNEAQPMLLRYNTDGSRDNGFAGTGLVQLNFDAFGNVTPSLAISNSGRIYLASSQEHSDGPFSIVCLKSDGTPETAFGGTGKITDSINTGPADNEHVYALAVQADGKVLAAGMYVTYSPSTKGAWVKRYNTDGTVDQNFGDKGIVKISGDGYTVKRILVMSDSRILCAGKTRSSQQLKDDFLLFRLKSDGSRDSTFGPTMDGVQVFGMQDIEIVNGIGLQQDGKIVIGGPCGNGYTSYRVIRLTENGFGDETFGTEKTSTGNFGYTKVDYEKYANQYVADLSVLPDDKIMIAGGWGANRFTVLQFTASGKLDSSFSGDGRLDSSFGTKSIGAQRAVFDQGTGRYYVVGSFSGDGITNCFLTAVQTGQGTGGIRNSSQNLFEINPNPATDVIRVMSDKVTKIEAYTVSGQKAGNSDSNELNVADFAPGVYILRVYISGSVATKKFIKQ